MEKYLPHVGEQLYLSQRTGNFYIDFTKRPYTVIEVSNSEVKVQECKLIYPIFKYDPKTMSDYYKEFDGKRVCFYDTIAESIEENPEGRILTLRWAPKHQRWQHTSCAGDRYPLIAFFGKWEHQPYLD